jgi:hypothetical protein
MSGLGFLSAAPTAPTVQMSPSQSGSPVVSNQPGALSEIRTGVSDVMHGQVSLLMLNSAILFLVAFYLWTHKVQGGG